jgi:hypothetical protein
LLSEKTELENLQIENQTQTELEKTPLLKTLVSANWIG